MVKNMKENTNENSDNIAAIGIGAMIVFIALILVAAVAAALGEAHAAVIVHSCTIVVGPAAGALGRVFSRADGRCRSRSLC